MKKYIRITFAIMIFIAVVPFVLASCNVYRPDVEGGRVVEDIKTYLEQNDGTIEGGNKDGENGTAVPIIDESFYIRAKVSSLQVRSEKNSNSTVLGTLDKGDMVAFISESDGFYETRFRNKTAYVSSNAIHTEIFALKLSESDSVEKVIFEGAKVLGTPYVYGAVRLHDGGGKLLKGFTVNKFDCSSLMQYMFYYGANINLNLTTRTQVKQGVSVAKADVQRGDLIFFTNSSRYYNKGIERIGHVAIYLGANYILHTASDHAVIEQISSTRWNYFIEAKRMIELETALENA